MLSTFALLALSAMPARAGMSAALEELGGAIEAEYTEDGETRTVRFPLLKTDMEAWIDGDLATVRITQVFENPGDAVLHGRYVFPLPTDAAVYAMKFVTPTAIVEGEIREIEQAKQEFEAAKSEGKQAALLSQHRPNVFSQEIANLTPNAPVEVHIEYAHAVPRIDGEYEFLFPMVVGPRFTGPQGDEPAELTLSQWNLPASAPVQAPDSVDAERVSVTVHLDGGVPIQRLYSPSHALDVSSNGPEWRTVALDEGRTIDNKDFVLRYGLATESVAAGIRSYRDGATGVVSLLLEPPVDAAPAELTPREMVFVLDCSGSMGGAPMDASKRFMSSALESLRPGDTFRIVRFSDAASELSDAPLPATPENIERGLRFVKELSGSGGTSMDSGVRAALEPATAPGTMRIVTFLTDGYIGSEAQITQLVGELLGDARLFSFGVGKATNRYLLEELARSGRGSARIVEDDEAADAAALELAERLESPFLTDISVDWGDAPLHAQTPAVLPDLFLGDSLRVLAHADGAGTWPITVHGRIAGEPVILPLEVTVPESSDRGEALPVIWARGLIEDRMIDYIDPRRDSTDREALQREVTALGLDHGLVTQWTAFVAVAKPIVNAGGEGVNADVPVAQVEGVGDGAYPSQALGHGAAFSAAPEPAEWAAILMLLALVGWKMRESQQAEA